MIKYAERLELIWNLCLDNFYGMYYYWFINEIFKLRIYYQLTEEEKYICKLKSLAIK